MTTLNEKIESSKVINDYITFEHPLNETMRICLLLEQLFNQVKEDINNISTDSHAKHSVDTIIRIIHVLDRPDLRGKLSKALAQQANSLSQLENNPQVNQDKLTSILSEIDLTYDALHENKNKISEQLRSNKIIKSILQYSASPGGPANFNIPNYLLWLNKNNQQKKQDMRSWINSFEVIKSAVTILLRLTRNSQNLAPRYANNSFFQVNLDSQPITQLIRVKIGTVENVWPEISVGRHRLAIYFKNYDESEANTSDIKFALACCY